VKPADQPALRIAPLVHTIQGRPDDYDPVMEMVGDARLVLLGEASHGTHEFYRVRAEITRRLIEEQGFNLVIVEADWPDAYRVNRYVRGTGSDVDASEALADFRRFPTWMWRNAEMVTLIDWIREWNGSVKSPRDQVGFYGMDLYSLGRSAEAVIAYLDGVDPEAAARARFRYSCFESFGDDAQAYGYAAEMGISPSCEDEVVQQLRELQSRAAEDGARRALPEDEHFVAEQNARLVRNAEEYYRSMFRGRVSSWNLRDSHMAETVDALMGRMSVSGARPRAVIWAHNSHLGDASATEMRERGEHNVGQLLRETYGDDARLIGFTTYSGAVTAATDWDEPARHRRVRPGLPGSWEELFHQVGVQQFFLDLGRSELPELHEPRLERAIGVIYRPETERISHYFSARIAQQFDGVIHIDTTSALLPLEPGELWRPGEEPPETYPTGL